MKLLLTGGFGYLGGRLAQFLVPAGHEIVLGSRRKSTAPYWLPSVNVMQTQWDSPDDLGRICSGVDAIVHLAGMNAQDCAADPIGAVEFNAGGTARLLHAAMTQGVRRFVYISTAHVYGSSLGGVISEETCPISLHPYATSHRAAEDVVRWAHESRKIEGIVVRLSNSYGAPARPEVDCWTLLVNDLCRQAAMTGCLRLNSAGTQRRDFIAMADACRAIGLLLELPSAKLQDGLFNAGGGWSPTILEVACRVGERFTVATGKRPELVRKVSAPNEDESALDYRITKLMSNDFAPVDGDGVNSEIDGLIQFCLKHFTGQS